MPSSLSTTPYRLVHVKITQRYSPANVHAVFSIQTVKNCTRLLCDIAKTSPVFFFRAFSRLRFFGKFGPPCAHFCWTKKKTREKTPADQASG